MLQFLDRKIKINLISLTILLSGIFGVNTHSFAQCVSEGISPTITTNVNCSKDITVLGLIESSIQWNSISPGAIGDFNSYLNCTSGCATTTFTPLNGIPPLVIFEASGISCTTNQFWSGQVIININPQVQIGFLNSGALLCFGANSTIVTAIVTGGTPSLNYVWNGPNIISGQGTTSIEVGTAGTYGIQVLDQSGCPPSSRGLDVFQQTEQPIASA